LIPADLGIVELKIRTEAPKKGSILHGVLLVKLIPPLLSFPVYNKRLPKKPYLMVIINL
jgi:hypothetical protein